MAARLALPGLVVLPVAVLLAWSVLRAQELPPIRAFDLQTIEDLGREIYRLDSYAWLATDILFEQGLDLEAYPLRGWVVTDTAEEPLVTFVGAYDEELRAVFDIRPDSVGSDRFEIAGGRLLTTEEVTKYRAAQTARTALVEPCSDRYNTVVLPDVSTDGWLVYLLAATADPNLIVVGGHYRVTTTADGLSIENADRLSVSCLTLEKSSADSPEGGELVMMAMSHLVSPTPVETHVYLSLLHEMNFAVITGENDYWIVSGDDVWRPEQ